MEPQSTRGGPAPLWTPTPREAATALLAGLALAWAYAPNLRALAGQWAREPNYSYGFFVGPVALALFWSRRDRLDRADLRPRWWGFLPLVLVLAARAWLYERNEQYAETATLPLAVAALTLALGGVHLVRAAGPALAFLGFLLPLPPSVNAWLALPLQRLATAGSLSALRLLGLPVVAEGNVIVVGSHPLEVARACNGLSMLLSFVTLVTAVALFSRRPLWERLLLLSTAVPIALASNVARIAATGVWYYRFGAETGNWPVHDMAGYAMMPLALALVGLELALWSWVLPEADPEAEGGAAGGKGAALPHLHWGAGAGAPPGRAWR